MVKIAVSHSSRFFLILRKYSTMQTTFDHIKTPDSLKTFLFLFLFFIFMFLTHGKTPDMIAARACFGPI